MLIDFFPNVYSVTIIIKVYLTDPVLTLSLHSGHSVGAFECHVDLILVNILKFKFVKILTIWGVDV